jgi:nicotinate-nucleotide adenylyltransferase
VGVFGGSFNPPHVAHMLAVAYVLATQPVDQVLVVPVFQHPFSKGLAPFDHRLAMCRAAFEWLPNVTVSTVERELGGDSLTLRTLEQLTATHPDWDFRLIIGSDVLPDLPKWHRFDRISEIAPPLVLDRAGWSERRDRVFLPEVSSTLVRELATRGDDAALASLVPRAVLAYMVEHAVYRAPTSP